MNSLSGTVRVSVAVISIFLFIALGFLLINMVSADYGDGTNTTFHFNATYSANETGYNITKYNISETMQVVIYNDDDAANSDPATINTINVSVESITTGCNINLYLYETGVDTGYFATNITFSTASGSCSAASRILEVIEDGEENVTIVYLDTNMTGYNSSSLAFRNTTIVSDQWIKANYSVMNFSTIAPGSSLVKNIVFNNSDPDTESGLTEAFTLYKEYEKKYSGVNDTKYLYFMLTNRTDYIVWNVTSNSTVPTFSVRLYNSNGVQVSYGLNKTYDITMTGNSSEVWYLKVINNNTAATSGVNITVGVYLNTTDFLSTNFVSGATNFTNSNTTIKMNMTIPALRVYGGFLNGTIKYYNDNFTVNVPMIVKISAAEMWTETNTLSPLSVWPNGTYVYKVNKFTDSKTDNLRTIKIYINNTGTLDLTNVWVNVTGNFTNTSKYINITLINSAQSNGNITEIGDYNYIALGTVPSNNNSYITLTFNISNIAKGDYDTILLFSSDNGQPFTDSNMTLRLNVTDALTVVVNNINTYNWDNISSTSDPATTRFSGNVTVEMTVKYTDGTPVTTFDKTNLTIFDDYTGVYVSMASTSIGSFVHSGSGIYKFNITAPARTAGHAQHGNHNLILQLKDDYVNNGNATTTYNMTAPDPYTSMSVSDSSLNLAVVETAVLTVTFGNSGTESAYNMTVSVANNGTGVTLDKTVCRMSVNLNSTLSIGAGETNTTVCKITLTPTAVGDYNISVSTVGARDAYGNDYNTTNRPFQIVHVTQASSSSEEAEEGGEGGGSSTPAPSLLITDYPSSMEILLGESYTTTVTVNNTGEVAGKVKLSVELAGIETDITPTETTISSGDSKTFEVEITVPDTFDIGNHATKFKAYVSLDTSIYDTADFTLTVLPTEEKKQEINQSYYNYEYQLNGLIDDFNDLVAQGKLSQENITHIENLINQSGGLLDNILAAIITENYITANDLMNDLNATLNNIASALEQFEEEEQTFAPIWMWVIIGLIMAGGAGFLIYMLMPPSKGYDIKYGYNSPKKETIMFRLKNLKNKLTRMPGRKIDGGLISSAKHTKILKKLDDKKDKSKAKYVSGYEKAAPTDYSFEPPSGLKANLISTLNKIKGKGAQQGGLYEFVSKKPKVDTKKKKN
ncbi:MAG: hypothetical protein ABIF08_03260 [Nanoarchaeota archaeon]